jgi:hypothetical protein
MLLDALWAVALEPQHPALPTATLPYQLRTSSLISVVLMVIPCGEHDFDNLRNVLDKVGWRQ